MSKLSRSVYAAAFVLTIAVAPVHAKAPDAKDFLRTYANLAQTSYQNALSDAKQLQKALASFAKKPTQKGLDDAKQAWLNSRESYGVTEIFRLSNGPIDAEEGWVAEAYNALEGQLNAWPLDENMIDYTIDAEGKKTSGNIIDSKGEFLPQSADGEAEKVNVSNITPEMVAVLNENGGDANVASGYHAIEFLLWGQDQDYQSMVKDAVSNGANVAGQRPLTDFTTAKYAKRRLAYLNAAAELLVTDLAVVASAWQPKIKGTEGLYRAALLGELAGSKNAKNIDQREALRQIFAGMGVFIKSELANERIAVAVLTPSEEDEHSCFSDNTHRDIATNYQGFKNVLMGEYNGKSAGTSAFKSLSKADQKEVMALITDIETRIATIDQLARTKMNFDYQIVDKTAAKNIVKLKNRLRKLGDKMVLVAKAYGVSLSENDVTDSEETQI